MRIYLNYENPYKTKVELNQQDGKLKFPLPIPDRYKVVKIREYIRYTPGLATKYQGSYFLGLLNGNIIYQSKLITDLGRRKAKSVKFDVPIDKLYEGYNNLDIAIYQSPVDGGYNQKGFPSVWTQIDIENSYIEMDFSVQDFEEKLSSISKFMFDNKSIIKGKVNFVLPAVPTETDFYNYSFMAYVISHILKFRDIDIFVSTRINNNMHNVIIAQWSNLSKIVQDRRILDKVKGNLNIVRNPNNRKNGILVITGNSQQELINGLYTLLDKDIEILDIPSIRVAEFKVPPKAPPLSGKGFFPFDKPVKLESSIFQNGSIYSKNSASMFDGDFKIYPIVNFRNSDNKPITLNLKYFASQSPNLQLSCNIYLNGILAYTTMLHNNIQENSEVLSENITFSPILLKPGLNHIRIKLTHSKSEDIKAKILESSTITIPKAEPETKLPNLEYISKLAFPFSIYSDLQDTGVLITDFHANTIASAFQVVFQLGRLMKTPPYYLTMTYDINKILDKNIIVVGPQISNYKVLYQNAPIKFIRGGIIKEQYIKELNKTIRTREIADFSNILFAQTYQSIFNPNRIVFELTAQSPKTLLKGVQNGFVPIQLGNFKGDVWLYNIETEDQQSSRYRKSYIADEVFKGFKNIYADEKYLDIENF